MFQLYLRGVFPLIFLNEHIIAPHDAYNKSFNVTCAVRKLFSTIEYHEPVHLKTPYMCKKSRRASMNPKIDLQSPIKALCHSVQHLTKA